MSDRVEIVIENHVAEVHLNRPEKKNALDPEFFTALADAGETLRKNKDIRAVVMFGNGGCFCAGIDTSSLMKMAGDIEAVRQELSNPPKAGNGNRFQRPTVVWQELEVPVIAAIEGVAFGGGAQIALAADFRIMAPDAKISIMEARWGIIPDMGITQSLPQLMRADRAKELIMTGRKVSADEALDLGLTTWVNDDPIAQARAFATELAAKSPDAIRGSKQLIDQTWAAGSEGLALEGELQAKIIGFPNQVETVMAQMQGRPAKYP